MREIENLFSGTKVIVTDEPLDRRGRRKVIRQYMTRSVKRRIDRRREDERKRSRRMAEGKKVVALRRAKEQMEART